MSTEIVDKLRAAKALIEDPKCWTTQYDARDMHGRATDANAEDAVCWCAFGAIIKVGGWAFDLILAVDAMDPELRILEVNDTQGHAAVMAMYNRAIAKAEALV